MTWKKTRTLIVSDIKRRLESDGRKKSLKNSILATLSPSCVAVIIFRLQHFFYHKKIYIISKILANINIVLFSVEIGSRCRIEEGFLIGHAHGIVVHDNVHIGENCTLMHQSAIGFRKDQKTIPDDEYIVTLEEGVLVGAGALLLGPLTVGAMSCIGMNALLRKSCPPQSIIIGVPGKISRSIESIVHYPGDHQDKHTQNPVAISLSETLRRLNVDLKMRAVTDGRTFSKLAYLKMFTNPPMLAVAFFRLSHWLNANGLTFISKSLTQLSAVLFKVEIGPKAEILGGLVLLHANGIFINNQTQIGRNVIFSHHNSVAIGPCSKHQTGRSTITIGNNCFIGAGARILGAIHIGDNVTIGINAVATHDIPNDTAVVGIPAHPLPPKSAGTSHASPPPPPPLPQHQEQKEPTLKNTFALIQADLQHREQLSGKRYGVKSWLKLPLNPAGMAVVLFRLAHYSTSKRWRLPAKFFSLLNILFFGVEIQSRASIGPGLILAHANGILIHNNTVIGKNCIFTVHNSVTIGPRRGLDPVNDKVVIGDNVFIGAGARIIGNLTIGDNTILSPKSVVTKSMPANTLVVGMPAKALRARR